MNAFLDALATALFTFVWQGAAIGIAYGAIRLAVRDVRLRHAAGVAALASMPLVLAGTLLTSFTAPPASPVSAWPTAADPADSRWILIAWLIGECGMAFRWFGGLWWLRRTAERASEQIPKTWSTAAERLRAELAIGTSVRILRSDRIDAPLLFGWLRPVILLPHDLERRLADLRLGQAAIESILAHELAHLARRDPLVLALQRLAESIFFYHPVTWWISSRVTHDRELCTDDLAVATLGQAAPYARTLTALEESRTAASPALAAHGGNLMSRILHLTTSHRRKTGASPLASLGFGSLLAAAFVAASLWAAPALADVSIAWLPDEVTRWNETFERAGERHGIDPELLAIMALVESRGNPDAVSWRGAVGLMQVMPATAARIAKQRGIELDPAQLHDPEVNVDFAAWYLSRHLEEFRSENPADQIELLAAAYNGGEHALRRHLGEGAPLSKETERYRKKVRELWLARDDQRVPGIASPPKSH